MSGMQFQNAPQARGAPEVIAGEEGPSHKLGGGDREREVSCKALACPWARSLPAMTTMHVAGDFHVALCIHTSSPRTLYPP
jgi:hypothetical protein